MYRKGHMGTDHFLGEIVVPLREVEEVDGRLKEADIRRYTLGRRLAKDKVSPLSACMGTKALITFGESLFSTMQFALSYRHVHQYKRFGICRDQEC